MRTLIAALALAFISTNVLAAEDDSYIGYDSIVNELKSQADEPARALHEDTWDEVALHAGVGVATSLVAMTLPDGSTTSGLFKGLQLTGGFNLYSKEWLMEGVFTTYQREALDQAVHGDLKEFEARLVYLPRLSNGMTVRMGTGLAQRSLDINSRNSSVDTSWNIQTPSYLLMLGLEKKLGKTVAVGPDLAYRGALTSSFDKSSWDASFRLNATF